MTKGSYCRLRDDLDGTNSVKVNRHLSRAAAESTDINESIV